MKLFAITLALVLQACATQSSYQQAAEEVPHYGLSVYKAKNGDTCYVYVERSNGVSTSCFPKK